MIRAIVAIVSVSFAFGSMAAGDGAALPGQEQPKIAWMSDLDAALVSAEQAGKPVLVEFFSNGCGWCKSLARDTHPNPRVIAAVHESFQPVRIQGRPQSMRDSYGLPGVPHTLILAGDGTLIHRIRGYRVPGDYLIELAQARRRYDAYVNAPAAWIVMREADDLLRHKKWQESLEAYRHVIDHSPEIADAHLSLAEAFTQLKEFESTLDALSSLEILDKHDPEINARRGDAHFALGNFEAAREAYLAGLSDPGWAGIRATMMLWTIDSLEGRREVAAPLVEHRLDHGEAPGWWRQSRLLRWAAGRITDESLDELFTRPRVRRYWQAAYSFYRGVDHLVDGENDAGFAKLKEAQRLDKQGWGFAHAAKAVLLRYDSAQEAAMHPTDGRTNAKSPEASSSRTPHAALR